jgi:hypothetical protein
MFVNSKHLEKKTIVFYGYHTNKDEYDHIQAIATLVAKDEYDHIQAIATLVADNYAKLSSHVVSSKMVLSKWNVGRCGRDSEILSEISWLRPICTTKTIATVTTEKCANT